MIKNEKHQFQQHAPAFEEKTGRQDETQTTVVLRFNRMLDCIIKQY